MRNRPVILLMLLLVSGFAVGADLPDKGKSPPTAATTRGPGGYPGDPGTPIGSGLLILLGLSSTYILVKRKKK